MTICEDIEASLVRAGRNERVDWNNYFMNIALMVSCRSTCMRRHYGAVIVKDNIIVSTGYNGAPSGEKHCLGNVCERERLNIPHGQQYEKCVAVHAEQNALIKGDPSKMVGAIIYIAGIDLVDREIIEGIPCDICRPMLKNAGIKEFVTRSTSVDSQVRLSFNLL